MMRFHVRRLIKFFTLCSVSFLSRPLSLPSPERMAETKTHKGSACHCLHLFFFSRPLKHTVTLDTVSCPLLFSTTSPAERYPKRLLPVSSLWVISLLGSKMHNVTYFRQTHISGIDRKLGHREIQPRLRQSCSVCCHSVHPALWSINPWMHWCFTKYSKTSWIFRDPLPM